MTACSGALAIQYRWALNSNTVLPKSSLAVSSDWTYTAHSSWLAVRRKTTLCKIISLPATVIKWVFKKIIKAVRQVEIELEECVFHLGGFHLQHICDHWNGFPADLLISLPGSVRLWQQQREIQTAPTCHHQQATCKGIICITGTSALCNHTPLLCFCVLGLEELL